MKRDLLNKLVEWGKNPARKPLILRGARQVGKSWLVREYAKQFDSFVEINFEKEKKAKMWFEGDLDVASLINTISLHKDKKITMGTTLLFFDEAQECENVLRVLRYFKEELPQLHVIAAGSLLDFAIDKIGLPVGRIQFLHLYPLSFNEFLTALGRDDLRRYIAEKQNEMTLHEKLLDLLKTYMWLGGLPEVVNQWLNTGDPRICQSIQDDIIETYMQDFHKYAKDRQIPYVSMLFERIPLLVGKKFKFSNIDPDIKSGVLKESLSLLQKAGIVYYCYHSAAQGQPLGSMIDIKKFKVFLFDIGITQRLMGLDIKEWLLKPVKLNNIGAIAEQLVAQELMAYSSAHKHAQLYYWHRESKNSNAEVDFVIIKNGEIISIEVKSASQGALRSMHLFLENHKDSPYGLKISENLFSVHDNIYEIPLYAINVTAS